MEYFKKISKTISIPFPGKECAVCQKDINHKLGSNMKLKDGEKGSQSHPGACNGCGYNLKGPRYISITAKLGRYRSGYIDYCQKCFLQLKDKASEKAKEIVAQDFKDGMVLDRLFTRILFNYGGYRDS